MQGRPPLLAAPNLDWAMNVGAQITPRTPLPGYSYVRVGDRQLLHQVVLMSRHFLSLVHLHKALNLPQLRRQEGWKIYLLSTGQFSLRGARGCLTNMRVVELRNARESGNTGNVASYNFLASSLPQDTRVYFQR